MSQSLPDANASTPRLPPRGALRRILEAIGVQNVSLLIALALLVAFIGGQNSNFFYSSNIATIGTTVAIVGILSVVQTVVMLLGGLDISVSSQAGLTSVVSAMVFMATQSAFAGIVAALVLGLGTGLLNGVIIIYGRVNAVIATLATLAAYRGLANLIANGRAQGYTGVDQVFIFLARGTIVGIPVLIWILVVVALLAQLVLHYTDFGRNIYAVGGNATAARLAGIPLNRYILAVYMLCGFVSALAGVLLTARTGSGQPTSGRHSLDAHRGCRAAGPCRSRRKPGAGAWRLLDAGRQGNHRRHNIRGRAARCAAKRPDHPRREFLLAGHRPGRASGDCSRHPAAPGRWPRHRSADVNKDGPASLHELTWTSIDLGDRPSVVASARMLLAVFARRTGIDPMEAPREIERIVDAKSNCDFLDRHVGGFQQAARPLHLETQEKVDGAEPRPLPEQGREMRGRELAVFGELFDAYVAIKGAQHERDDIFDAFLGRFGGAVGPVGAKSDARDHLRQAERGPQQVVGAVATLKEAQHLLEQGDQSRVLAQREDRLPGPSAQQPLSFADLGTNHVDPVDRPRRGVVGAVDMRDAWRDDGRLARMNRKRLAGQLQPSLGESSSSGAAFNHEAMTGRGSTTARWPGKPSAMRGA